MKTFIDCWDKTVLVLDGLFQIKYEIMNKLSFFSRAFNKNCFQIFFENYDESSFCPVVDLETWNIFGCCGRW